MKTFALLLCIIFILPTSANTENVRPWGYQLQNAEIMELMNSPFDLLVIDYSKDGLNSSTWSPEEIETLKHQGKTVISYISIGEAEDYRYYWNETWKNNPPSWLDEENPDWKGNYKVRFWEHQWQTIILDYIRIIMNIGFDGLYFDMSMPMNTMRKKGFLTQLNAWSLGSRLLQHLPDK